MFTRQVRVKKNHHELFQKDLITNKSYFSKTTSQFQLGVLSEREWIGNELRFFNDRALPYSVIATKPMRVFSITKENFLENTPKDLLPYFDEISLQKCKWIQSRFDSIAKNINQMKDAYFEKVTEQSNEV